MNILVIEDELNLAETLEQILINNSYKVDIATDGLMGLDYALSDNYDLILLDVMMPKMNGFEVLKKIRDEKLNVPVIMLTAKGTTEDKVNGLDAGADDYLPKPFETTELLARIRANLRRKETKIIDNNLSFGNVKLDTSLLTLKSDTEEINLTNTEVKILELLILRANNVTSKDMIIDKVWDMEKEIYYNHVEVYISFLRKKLSSVDANFEIKTIRKIGYTLKGADDDV